MIIIGVDPGKTVGTAQFNTIKNTLCAGEIDFDDFGNWLNVQLDFYKDREEVVIVCERFTISYSTIKKSADAHWALEAIGVTRYLANCYSRQFHMQLVSPVKMLSTDERLRSVGWYIKGKGHANDAVRHIIYFMANVLTIYPAWIGEMKYRMPEQLNFTDWIDHFPWGRLTKAFALLVQEDRTDSRRIKARADAEERKNRRALR